MEHRLVASADGLPSNNDGNWENQTINKYTVDTASDIVTETATTPRHRNEHYAGLLSRQEYGTWCDNVERKLNIHDVIMLPAYLFRSVAAPP